MGARYRAIDAWQPPNAARASGNRRRLECPNGRSDWRDRRSGCRNELIKKPHILRRLDRVSPYHQQKLDSPVGKV